MILPVPFAPFDWVHTSWGPALVCRAIEPFAAHLFTTRGWSLGTVDPSDAPGTDAAWSEVAAAVGVDAGDLVRGRQVHGAAVLVANDAGSAPKEADIVVCNDNHFAAAIQMADCAPVLIADGRRGAVAAAHAGWRGLAARVPATAVRALAELYGSRPDDLIAAVGPSIGPCCYEVGVDVHDRFSSNGFGGDHLEAWFVTKARTTARNRAFGKHPPVAAAGHWYFDVWQAVRDQLEGAGIPAAQIHVAELCTASHPEVWNSYRRDGVGAGRLAAAIRPLPRRP